MFLMHEAVVSDFYWTCGEATMSMRVAMIDPAGFSLPYDRELCAAMRAAGVDVRLITVAKENDQIRPEEDKWWVRHFYQRAGYVEAMSVRGSRFVKGLEHAADLHRLVGLLRRWRPDIIHFQWLVLPVVDLIFLRTLRRLAPLVLTAHDTQPYNGQPSSRVQLWRMNDVIHGFDRIVVHTAFSRKELVMRLALDPSKLVVVPHGALMHYRQRRHPDSPFGLSDKSGKRLLFFGTVKPYKGLDVLLKAISKLDSSVTDGLQLDVVGLPKMDVAPLQLLARTLGIGEHVKWDLRYVPDEEVGEIFRRVALVVLPYRRIDQSGVLLTALAMGRPVVASRVGGIAEIIKDGVQGRLVPPDDASALAEALSQMLKDPGLLLRMGAAARALAETRFDWSAIANKTRTLYETLLAERDQRNEARR